MGTYVALLGTPAEPTLSHLRALIASRKSTHERAVLGAALGGERRISLAVRGPDIM